MYKISLSQHDFDSIKICHAKGELKDITIGEYEVQLTEGHLSILSSKDGAISYETKNKLFIVKNLIKGSSLKLQLANEGIIITTRDTSFLLNSPKSIYLTPLVEDGNIEALFSIDDFSFSLEFKNNRLNKISLPTTGKYISINLEQIQGSYIWDFFIESTRNKVLLTYSFNNPYSLSIFDDKDKVGIRLLTTKKNGLFTLLQGIKVYGKNSFESDKSYKLQYTNSGKLKKNSGFNLSCQY